MGAADSLEDVGQAISLPETGDGILTAIEKGRRIGHTLLAPTNRIRVNIRQMNRY